MSKGEPVPLQWLLAVRGCMATDGLTLVGENSTRSALTCRGRKWMMYLVEQIVGITWIVQQVSSLGLAVGVHGDQELTVRFALPRPPVPSIAAYHRSLHHPTIHLSLASPLTRPVLRTPSPSPSLHSPSVPLTCAEPPTSAPSISCTRPSRSLHLAHLSPASFHASSIPPSLPPNSRLVPQELWRGARLLHAVADSQCR